MAISTGDRLSNHRHHEMLGVATEEALLRAFEQRLGSVLDVAATLELRCLAIPERGMRLRKPKEVVIALTESASGFWILETERAGSQSAACWGRLLRRRVVSHWRPAASVSATARLNRATAVSKTSHSSAARGAPRKGSRRAVRVCGRS